MTGFWTHPEIVAHVTRDLVCDTPEEAASVFRKQLLSDTGAADTLLQLAVWRQDSAPASSPLPAGLRGKLTDFFTSLEQCAGEAEEAFRVRVEAILTAHPATPDAERGG